MIIVLNGRDRGVCRDLFEQQFRFRYEVFVKGQGRPASAEGSAIDQYDTDLDTEDMTEDEIAAAVYEWLNDETIVAGQTAAGNLVYVQF